MADIDKLDGQLRAALTNYAGMNIAGSDANKANYAIVWAAAPSAADLSTSASIIAAFDANAEARSVAVERAVRNAAKALNGTAANSLTAAQAVKLVALLAFREGWIAPDGTINIPIN